MSINNISDTDFNQYKKDPKYKFINGKNDTSEDCTALCKPTKISFIRYLFRKIWDDKKLRVMLILSILVIKILMTLIIILLST
jgi:hypothetical protein